MRISDWSSDVCSSDLPGRLAAGADRLARHRGGMGRRHRRRVPGLAAVPGGHRDRKSVVLGKSVSVRVDVGGRRIIKKKQNMQVDIKTESRKNRRNEKTDTSIHHYKKITSQLHV